MDIKQAYNTWANQYDTNENRTRDLEAVALKRTLMGKTFGNVLEIGCGTGKNTQWLQAISNKILAIDLSDEMLLKAKEKVKSDAVTFQQADITKDWYFANTGFDLITFSLVLEHIENLDTIFDKAVVALNAAGYIYIGELHPFKQHLGSKARFDTEHGTQVLTCFNHHVSDFTKAALERGLVIEQLNEYFDDEGSRTGIPRILTLLLRRN